MNRNRSLSAAVLTLVVGAAAVLLYLLWPSGELVGARPAVEHEPWAGPPPGRTATDLRLRIPAIEVDAPLREMTPDGTTILVSTTPDEVAWYRTTPGVEGAHGLLLGHVNWRDGSTGVFARLGALAPGDTVELQDGAATVTYVVTATREVSALTATIEGVIDTSANDTLTLITCSGDYLWDHGTYSQRTVVTAVRTEG